MEVVMLVLGTTSGSLGRTTMVAVAVETDLLVVDLDVEELVVISTPVIDAATTVVVPIIWLRSVFDQQRKTDDPTRLLDRYLVLVAVRSTA
jgi:hypothetical protein